MVPRLRRCGPRVHAQTPGGFRMNDLFPEVVADPVIAARHRAFSRHQHSAVVDPNNNERYTLRPTLEECMRLGGVDHIDIDVAACSEAHCAPEWLGQQLDGTFRDALATSWKPRDIVMFAAREGLVVPHDAPVVGWMNEPYDMLLAFTERAALAMADGELDVLLSLPPGDRCEQDWWQKWIEPYRDGKSLFNGNVMISTHCLDGRQKFGSPGDPTGLTASSAPFPSVLIVYRRVSRSTS